MVSLPPIVTLLACRVPWDLTVTLVLTWLPGRSVQVADAGTTTAEPVPA
jgi:hypothetical protein